MLRGDRRKVRRDSNDSAFADLSDDAVRLHVPHNDTADRAEERRQRKPHRSSSRSAQQLARLPLRPAPLGHPGAPWSSRSPGSRSAYEGIVAVAGVSFSVAAGEIPGLVGPNGAGKTTTLRCLGGILRPSAGTVKVAGRDIVADPVGAKQHLAFLPDEPRLFEYLSVREHLNLVARLYRVAGWEAKADALLSELELADKRDD
jgi:ABC-type glutathione transport system ATPase component